MKLLRWRKIILVILVVIWFGGMIYFLVFLIGLKDDIYFESFEFDSLRFGDDGFE